MTPQLQATARTCLRAAYDNSMTFPEIVGLLMAAGFESYIVDYRRNVTTYYLPDGDHIMLENDRTEGHVAPDFNKDALTAAIREAQDNVPGYSYVSFCGKAKHAGCALYMVSFPGRRAIYFGRNAETHVEHFPK